MQKQILEKAAAIFISVLCLLLILEKLYIVLCILNNIKVVLYESNIIMAMIEMVMLWLLAYAISLYIFYLAFLKKP